MRDIVRMANRRHKLSMDDPTEGCALPRQDPGREWLPPVQFQALLDVAEMLDAHPARREYTHHGRYSALLALGLLGLRVSEFCAARWRDLSGQGLFVPEAKTSAGRRHLELPAVVRAVLEQRRAELDPRPEDHIWATAAGARRDRRNVRTRLLAPVLEIGALLLEARGQRPLPVRVDAHGVPARATTLRRERRWSRGCMARATTCSDDDQMTSSSGRPRAPVRRRLELWGPAPRRGAWRVGRGRRRDCMSASAVATW